MASRRKIEPEGDTPGKPPEKKASAQKNKGRKKRLAFTSQEKDVENDRTWLPQEKKTLIQFYVDKHINNWPTHRHYPTSDPPDTYSMCAEYVNSVWGKARTGGACRGVIQRFLQFKDTETPDLAWEKFNIPEPTVMNLFQKLAEEEKLQALDAMFKLTLEDSNMSNYSPANLPSLSLLAMNNLMSAERPNTIANLLTALTGTFDNGKPRMSIDRMPYPLIETNLQFFASNHFNQVKFHPTYHQWLQTMYAHFGGKFTALFNGPMWKVEKENDDSHRQVLEKAFNPSSSSSSPTTPSTPSTGSTSQPPPLRPASTPSTSSHSPPMQLTSTPSTSSQPPPSRPASAPSTSSHSPPMQLTSTPSTSNQPPPLRPASAPSTSSHSPPMQLTSTPSTSSQPPPSRPASAPSTSSHSPPMQLTSTPSTSNQPPPFRPASAPSFWTTVDDEMRVAQIEGVSNRDHEKELLEYHGLQGQRTKPKHVYKATQDAMVNVVGLSDRQLRRDFAKTDYTPGPSIQPAILHQAKKTHPHGRWWIKADACDISTGLRESMTGEWTGDVDMGDGKLQQLHSQYKLQLETINRLTISHIHKQLSSLKKEADEIKEGLDKSQKIYDEKCEAGLGQKRKLNYAWHLQGWKDLQKQNQELTTALTSATASGKEDTFADLKMQLAEYTKGLFMKRRKMASHLLIFMISDELRNKKPYAIPVRIMPVASVKDAEIRRLQVELRKVMEGEGMEVVGFVTDGEWNSLRTMGTSRPTSLIQVIMQAKAEAGKMDTPALEKVLKPNIRQDAEDPTHFHISRKTVHEAVPFADLVEMAKDKVNGMEWKQVLQVHHKRIYPYVPKPKPWVPGTSEEKELESMRSIMATYIFRHKVQKYKEQGIDFTQHIYVPELVDVDGFSFDDREDHGHLFKRIVKCARLGQIPDCDISRWMEALSDKDAMLTAKALRGVDAQSVPDAERMFSKSIVNFMQSKGYDTDAKFASIVLSWHKATDGRGLSEDERHQYNMDMLNYILDDWMPFHRSHTDFSQVDINKPIKGIRGLTREVVIGITTNIYSQELRRARLDLSPEHPRASTSDDVEGFIALLHYILGRTFDHKAFVAAYRKIFQEFQKMMDEDLPFLYYQGLKHRYTTDVLPSFNVPSSSGKPERLDRVRGRRLGNIGSSVTSRAAMPRSGQRTSRDSFWRVLEPLPPITDN